MYLGSRSDNRFSLLLFFQLPLEDTSPSAHEQSHIHSKTCIICEDTSSTATVPQLLLQYPNIWTCTLRPFTPVLPTPCHSNTSIFINCPHSPNHFPLSMLIICLDISLTPKAWSREQHSEAQRNYSACAVPWNRGNAAILGQHWAHEEYGTEIHESAFSRRQELVRTRSPNRCGARDMPGYWSQARNYDEFGNNLTAQWEVWERHVGTSILLNDPDRIPILELTLAPLYDRRCPCYATTHIVT